MRLFIIESSLVVLPADASEVVKEVHGLLFTSFLSSHVVHSCCRGLLGHMCGTSVSSCYYKTDANINGVNLFLHAKSFQMHWLKMVNKYKKNTNCFTRTVYVF